MPHGPLSDEQVEHYFREGYVIVRGLARPTTCRSVVAAHLAGPPRHDAASDGRWEAIVFDHGSPDGEASRHLLLVDPGVTAAVSQLFEDEPRVYYGMLATIAPHGGRGLAWHQDNQYDHLLGHALNTFIACGDISPEMGNLWIAPRSHLLGVQPSRVADGHHQIADDPVGGICLPQLACGDGCIFNRSTIHRSQLNHGTQVRFAYAAQFCDSRTRRAKDGRKDPRWHPVGQLAARWTNARA